jgi:hypothetical protein
MSFAKLFSSITESSLWGEQKEVRLLFVSMLARADSTGFVEASLPGLARMANLTVAEVEMALEVLEGPDPHSKNPEFEGRRIDKVDGGWMLLNYDSYRNRRSDEDRRGYMRDYMRERRSAERRKQSVNPTANSVSENANSRPSVNHGKPALAQEETETETETRERESAAPPSPNGDSPSASTSKKKKASSRFVPPTLEEVTAYCLERNKGIDPQRFINYYTANGWVQGRGKAIKDWKAAIRAWEGNSFAAGGSSAASTHKDLSPSPAAAIAKSNGRGHV